jgi:hypothetical protein
VNEEIWTTVITRDESKTLVWVKPFNRSGWHVFYRSTDLNCGTRRPSLPAIDV